MNEIRKYIDLIESKIIEDNVIDFPYDKVRKPQDQSPPSYEESVMIPYKVAVEFLKNYYLSRTIRKILSRFGQSPSISVSELAAAVSQHEDEKSIIRKTVDATIGDFRGPLSADYALKLGQLEKMYKNQGARNEA